MPSVFECAYRRFYFDGFAEAKFEIGLSDDKNNREGKRAKDETTGASLPYRDAYSLADIVQRFLGVQLRIRDPFGQKTESVEIGRASKALGRLYLAGSTPQNQLHAVTNKPAWVEPGTPLLLVAYDRDVTRLTLPVQMQTVTLLVSARQVGLHHYTLVTSFGARRMWLLSYNAQSDLNFVRNLRIYLCTG